MSKIFLNLTTLCFLSIFTFANASEYKQIECLYAESHVIISDVHNPKFYLKIDKMNVSDSSNAQLTYMVSLLLNDDEIWVGRESSQTNVSYNGRRYNNHFKFELKLFRASEYNGSSGAVANLIISKEITSTSTDRHGATIQKFDAVLDVHYDDHHGDYIPLECRIRFFDPRN